MSTAQAMKTVDAVERELARDLDCLVTDDRNMQAVGEIHQRKQDLLHAQMRKELGWPKPRIHVKAKSRRRMA